MTLKTFTYENELYIRVIPGKRLFNSTMIHEVVNRGDIFAVRVSDSQLTIIPGQSQVEHSTHQLIATAAQIAKEMKSADEAKEARKELARIMEEFRLGLQRK